MTLVHAASVSDQQRRVKDKKNWVQEHWVWYYEYVYVWLVGPLLTYLLTYLLTVPYSKY